MAGMKRRGGRKAEFTDASKGDIVRSEDPEFFLMAIAKAWIGDVTRL
jgi:hypothetical protein